MLDKIYDRQLHNHKLDHHLILSGSFSQCDFVSVTFLFFCSYEVSVHSLSIGKCDFPPFSETDELKWG